MAQILLLLAFLLLAGCGAGDGFADAQANQAEQKEYD